MAAEEKTEQPSAKKLREARSRGNIPSSPEITASVLGVVSIMAINQQGEKMAEGLMSLLKGDLTASGTAGNMTQDTMMAQIRSDVLGGLLLLVPLVATLVLAALVIGAINTRGLVSLKKLVPSFSKLNPLSNAKNIFGKEGLVMLGKALAKILIVAAVIRAFQGQWEQLVPQLAFMGVGPAVTVLWSDITHLVIEITVAFAILGALDSFFHYRKWRKQMKMTKQEVKEEFKSQEGNQQVKARMRQTGRRRLREIMSGGLRAVPKADVVITNPTHFAIAIQYQPGKMRAPKVIAKGQRIFAQRMKEVARKHNIPMVENKPLAQALFKSVKPGQEIPAELYQAVAQVLAFVYRLRGAGRAPVRPVGRPVTPGGR